MRAAFAKGKAKTQWYNSCKMQNTVVQQLQNAKHTWTLGVAEMVPCVVSRALALGWHCWLHKAASQAIPSSLV